MSKEPIVTDDEKELGKAIKAKRETIVIEGDLKNKVVKIKATGKVAWAVAIGGIAIALAIILATGGTGILPTLVVAAPTTVSILGLPAAVTAVSIAIAGGGVAVLNKLRKYKIIENNRERLVLRRN